MACMKDFRFEHYEVRFQAPSRATPSRASLVPDCAPTAVKKRAADSAVPKVSVVSDIHSNYIYSSPIFANSKRGSTLIGGELEILISQLP